MEQRRRVPKLAVLRLPVFLQFQLARRALSESVVLLYSPSNPIAVLSAPVVSERRIVILSGVLVGKASVWWRVDGERGGHKHGEDAGADETDSSEASI